MNLQILVTFCVMLVVLLCGICIVIRARSKHTLSKSFNGEDSDFIDAITSSNKKRLEQKPWTISYKTYKAIATSCAIAFALVAYLAFDNLLIILLGAVIGTLIPEIIIVFQDNSRKSKFDERFARSLRQMASSLKAGRSIQQAVDDVCSSDFIHESVRSEFVQLSSDLRLGVPISDAFDRFAQRVHCEDAKDVAVAINMQLKVGGREAQAIESIAKSISNRINVKRETKSMFAGANMTVLVMDFMPFAIVFSLMGDYMAPIKGDATLTFVLIAMVALMAVGSFVTHGMIRKTRRECGIE